MSDATGLGAVFSSIMNTVTAGNAQQQQQYLTEQQRQDLQDALAKINAVGTPDGSFNLTPPEQYALQHYATPEQARAQQINVDPADRANQMAALQKMQGYSNGAADSELNAANYTARNNAAMMRQRSDAATMQNLASRGVAGSGLELAAKQQSAQNAANSAQSGGLEAARNNALAKMQGNNAYLSGLSSLRGQDTGLATANANIINQFNMANTNARNAANQANVGLTNQQNTMNTSQQNAYQQYLAQMQKQAQEQAFQDQLSKARAAAGQQTQNATTNYGAGMTGVALGANTGAAIAGGIGNAAQGIYQSVSANDSYNPNSATVEQAPKPVNVTDGSSFTGDGEEEGY